VAETCSEEGKGSGVHKEFWLGNLKENNNLEDTGIDERIMLKYILE
jgi:hypothetical protein